MARIVAIDHFTLDGVIQGPAALDEDRRDGFEYGGWAGAQYDPELQKAVGARMNAPWSLLAGRRTYEHFFKVWPRMAKPNPFTDVLNRVDKFVVSGERSQSRSRGRTLISCEATVQRASSGSNASMTRRS